ncbi:universal stress protein [Flavobacteriales bacterium]|nr:universal stress protein [Flavobacteriales bacterium]
MGNKLLNDLNRKYKKEQQVNLEIICKKGDIYKDKAKVSESQNIALITMGIHDIKDFDKILGSKAMKVIAQSETPFILVQKDSPKFSIQSILFSIDANPETRVKVNKVAELSVMTSAVLDIVYTESDEVEDLMSIKNNQKLFVRFLRLEESRLK